MASSSVGACAVGTDQPAAQRVVRGSRRATVELGHELVAVAAVDRAHVLDDARRRPRASCARTGTPASAAARRARPTPPRSSPSARSSACRRRSRCRSAPGGCRRTTAARGRRGARPGTSDSRTWSVSIAIVSWSASRSRLMITTGSDGETCRSRPRCAPAGDDAEVERAAARHHAAAAHVLGEGGHRQLLGDLRLADERAAAVAADEHPVADEIVERGPHREPRDAEVGAQLPLGRDRVADAELLDQVEDAAPRLALLRDGAGWCRRRCLSSLAAIVGL